MPKVEINGNTYNIKEGAFRRVYIQHPSTGDWHLLKVCAITRDGEDDVYVMPIKTYLNQYKYRERGTKEPAFLGALPNTVGGNAEFPLPTTRSLPVQTILNELRQETHGQYELASEELSFLNLLFVPDYCYVFYSCDIRQSGKRLFPSTTAMKEMTGDHLILSASDLLKEINQVRLTALPTKGDIKEAILRFYRSTTMPKALRKRNIETLSIDANAYDQRLLTNEKVFMNEAHAIDALAGFLLEKITPTMEHEQKVRAQQELERQELERQQEMSRQSVERQAKQRLKARNQLVLISMAVIILLVGLIVGKVPLFGGT